jgi:hypothetical protein
MMSRQKISIVVGALALGACSPGKLDVGMAGSSGSSSGVADGSAASGSSGSGDGVASCEAGVLADGTGFLGGQPLACSETLGTLGSFASADAVTAALIGVWSQCVIGTAETQDFLAPLDASAIQFTPDGHFTLLTSSATDATLVPLPGVGANSGSYAVTDASATLGAGTFQLRLTATTGEVYAAQTLVYGSPARLRLVSGNHPSDYAHAISKAYQANVCGPTLGTPVTPASSDALASDLTGRWARCGIDTLSVSGQGIEFPGDGTFYYLVVDDSGNLVRSNDASEHGTLTALSPIEIQLQTSNGTEEQHVRMDACGSFQFYFPFSDAGETDSGQFTRIP